MSSSVVETIRNEYSPNLLKGKTALVTGGSRGIGRGIAVALAACGAKVIVNYAGNEAAAQETLKDITSCGSEGSLLRFNVGAHDEVQAALKEIATSVDILVNNAGVSRDGLLVRAKDEDWNATLDINLKGAFLCSRTLAMGMMKKKWGRIINISSVIGLSGNAGQAAYAASKAGLIGLTKSLAQELASRNINVNALAPGYIETDMTSAGGDKLKEMVLTKIPQNKLGSALDIARVAVFLAGPTSDYVTGQTIAVDGGMTMY